MCNDKPLETFELDGKTIEIWPDFDPSNPRVEYDNFGHLVCWHSQYNLTDPDQKDIGSLGGLLNHLLVENGLDYADYGQHFRPVTIFGKAHKRDNSRQYYGDLLYEDFENDLLAGADWALNEAFGRLSNKLVILPVFIYDHGGITISTSSFSCPWDSGQVGFIYVTRDEVLKEYGRKRLTRKLTDRVEKLLKAEIKEFDQYLTGDVYGYVIKDDTGEVVDSCWGFYGYEYCLEEAKAIAMD